MSEPTVPPGGHAGRGVVPQRLRPPVLHGEVRVRTRQLERLVGSDATLVALRAGAGFGKTTLLRQWVDADDRPSAWLGIDPTDGDPAVFLRHLVAALTDAGQDLRDVQELLDVPGPLPEQELLPAMAEALDRPAGPFLLVLDDVHLLAGTTSVAILDLVIAGTPPGSTVALAGRRLPPIHLTRRIVEGAALELTQGDLAFDDEESAELVGAALPEIDAATARALVERTEGWPAGLSLGVLALRDHPEPDVLVAGLLAQDRRVAEYFHEEVLDQVEPDVRQFLLRAAALEVLSGAACDEVLERADSRALLDELVASGNLFVVGIESDPDGFRLHHLFRDLLVARLRREDRDEERRIRKRAAEWHDARGESDLAVRQALASGDLDFAAEMIQRQTFPAVSQGRVRTLQQWVDAFPPERRRTDGLVALCAGWAALIDGRRDELLRLIQAAHADQRPGPLPDGTVTFAVGLAALEMLASLDGVKGTAEQARLIREAGPEGSPWWPMARLQEVVALSLAGAVEPVSGLAGVEFDARGYPAVHAAAMAQLGLAHLRGGDTHAGQRWCEAAMEELRSHRMERYSMGAIVHCAAAYAAARRGDHHASVRAAEDGAAILLSMADVIPRAQVQGWLILADAAVQRNDRRAAHEAMARVLAVLPQEPDAVRLIEWADELSGRVERLRPAAEEPALSAAEARVLDQLPTHRSLAEIGDRLYVSRNTVKTHTVSIYRKLGVSSRSEAVARAAELGLLPADDRGTGEEDTGGFTRSG